MKKTMMIAALFAASAFSAFAVDVYSSNIVGYTRVPVAAGFNMLGTQFVNVGDNASLNINDLLTTDDLLGLDGSFAFQTEMKVWNGGGYDFYGWFDADDGTNVGDSSYNSKWVKYDFSGLADVDMTIGEGFWIQTPAGGTVTFAGQVSTNDTENVAVGAGFNMVVNPFPTALPIQNIQSGDLAGLDGSFAFQTEMKVWNGGGYDFYGWFDADDGTNVGDPTYNSKWVKYDFSGLANVTNDIGEAFWIQTSAPATMTFTK